MSALPGAQLQSLPFPVAHPLALAQDGELPASERMAHALFAAYQAAHTAALLLLVDYLEAEAGDRAVEEAVRGLRHPSFKEWAELCDALCTFWTGAGDAAPERATRFPSLVEGWRSARALHARLADVRLAHALGRAVPALEAVAEEAGRLCAALFPAGAFTLLRRAASEPPMALSLHGPNLLLDFVPAPVDASLAPLLERSEVVALAGAAGLPLFPFFAAGGAEPVVLVDAIRERKLVLLGVRTREETPRHFSAVQAALSRKPPAPPLRRADVTRAAVSARARVTTRDELSQLKGRRYLPETYVERRGIDAAAGQAFQRGGRALLLLGDAGRGKSSLLLRMVDALTAAPGGDVAVLLAGRAAYAGDATWSGPRLLCEAVLRKLGVEEGAFTELPELLAHLDAAPGAGAERKVWLVLDGLEEADRFPEWVAALDALLPCTVKYPWLRLAFSCRTGEYAALERHGRVFVNEQHLYGFFDEREQRDKPYLGLRPFDRAEGAAAYERRAGAFPGRACPLAWGQLPPGARELLCHPLNLHLFHDAYAGSADVPAGLDDASLMDAYLERLCAGVPLLRETLDRASVFQLERARPQWASEHVDEWTGAYWERPGLRALDRVARLDPVEAATLAAPLLRPAREGVGTLRRITGYGWVHQRLGEQLLLRELRRQAAPRTELDETDLQRQAEYAAWHPEFFEYQEALRSVVARAVREGREAVMAGLLLLPQDGVRTRWLETALRTVGLTWGSTREGREGPRRALAALVAAARRGARPKERFLAVSGVAPWLEERHCAWGAVAVSEARLEVSPEDAGRALSHSGLLARVGRAERKARRLGEARRCFERSLALRRALAKAQPGNLEVTGALSSALSRMGSLEEEEGRLAEAKALYEEGLLLDRALVAADGAREEPQANLAVALTTLGDVEERTGQYAEARALFGEALAIDRKMVAAAPHRKDLAERLSSRLARLGGLEQSAGRLADARACLEESLSVRRALRAAEPLSVERAESLARALDRLARLEESERRFDAARALELEALALERALAASHPWREDVLSSALARVGNLELAAGQLALARPYFEESLSLRRALAEKQPTDVEVAASCVRALDRLGVLEESLGRTVEAGRFYGDALALARKLSAGHPGSAGLLLGLAAALVRWAKFKLSLGAALPTGEAAQAMELLRRVQAVDAADAAVAEQLGDALCTFARCCPGEGAVPYWHEGLALLRKAHAAEPRNLEFATDLRDALTLFAAARTGAEAEALAAEAAALR